MKEINARTAKTEKPNPNERKKNQATPIANPAGLAFLLPLDISFGCSGWGSRALDTGYAYHEIFISNLTLSTILKIPNKLVAPDGDGACAGPDLVLGAVSFTPCLHGPAGALHPQPPRVNVYINGCRLNLYFLPGFLLLGCE